MREYDGSLSMSKLQKGEMQRHSRTQQDTQIGDKHADGTQMRHRYDQPGNMIL